MWALAVIAAHGVAFGTAAAVANFLDASGKTKGMGAAVAAVSVFLIVGFVVLVVCAVSSFGALRRGDREKGFGLLVGYLLPWIVFVVALAVIDGL